MPWISTKFYVHEFSPVKVGVYIHWKKSFKRFKKLRSRPIVYRSCTVCKNRTWCCKILKLHAEMRVPLCKYCFVHFAAMKPYRQCSMEPYCVCTRTYAQLHEKRTEKILKWFSRTLDGTNMCSSILVLIEPVRLPIKLSPWWKQFFGKSLPDHGITHYKSPAMNEYQFCQMAFNSFQWFHAFLHGAIDTRTWLE
jgi:hypothetical protein